MEEGKAVGEKLGVRFALSVDARIKAAEEVGAHRTSMLQDLERGRPMEIEALVGVVSELGRLVDVPTPTIDTVYHLVVRRAREAGATPNSHTNRRSDLPTTSKRRYATCWCSRREGWCRDRATVEIRSD